VRRLVDALMNVTTAMILRLYEYCTMCMDMFMNTIMGMFMDMFMDIGMKCMRNSFPICYAKPPDSH